MTNRHKKIVLEAEEGITFEVSEAGGELVIRAKSIVQNAVQSTAPSVVPNIGLSTAPNMIARSTATVNVCHNLPTVLAGEYAEQLSIYTDKDGNQAVVLPGWTVSGVEKENTIWGKDVSLVIYRIPKEISSIDWADQHKVACFQKTYSQLVWVPVKFLQSNGTLDGYQGGHKFGRRNYRNNKFSFDGFNEPVEGGLLKQKESVSQYGGFYISRYDISKSPEGAPQSVKGAMPWVNINFPDAQRVAATFECNDVAQSQLTYGTEDDSLLEWIIESGCKTRKEVAEDSTNWGNHWNTKGSPRRVVETGSREECCANNVYDVAGNVDEWTQERYGSSFRVLRGGRCSNCGYYYPAAYRCKGNPGYYFYFTGFRLTVYIK